MRFFRVIDGFMVQFGMHGNPAVAGSLAERAASRTIRSSRATSAAIVTFATAGPNTRTTQVFINFGDNAGLDKQGFAPFGEVRPGMDVVDKLYNGYGEGAPSGKGPTRAACRREGNAYLNKEFPQARLHQERDDREVTEK